MNHATPSSAPRAQDKTDAPPSLLRIFAKSLLLPVLVLGFFFAAPQWLDHNLHEQVRRNLQKNPHLTPIEAEERIALFDGIDFAEVCLRPTPEYEDLRADLEASGVASTFRRLRWGLGLSITLNVLLLLAIFALRELGVGALASNEALIRRYRLAWRLSVAAALVQILLLIPLLAYGSFEFTVLLSDHYYPKLILAIVLGGLFALWGSMRVLLRRVPLEFTEPMARAVTPDEAPELWAAVRDSARRLDTAPPDHILVGMQLNFYVTELAVNHDGGRAEGRTLFLSRPLLKHLPVDEVVAIIGHELGHFIGADTRITREFYPLRLKAGGTMIALAQSGLVGWTSLQFLNFFGWCFGRVEQTVSRRRELLADRKAAELTSPRVMAHALIRIGVLQQALELSLEDAAHDRLGNPFDAPLPAIIREKLLPKADFWQGLLELRSPHPLDSHPPLHERLAALDHRVDEADAARIAIEEHETAHSRWLAHREHLFSDLARQTDEAVAKMRTRVRLSEANDRTEAGRRLLETHFPERRWTTRASSFWTLLVIELLGVAATLVPVVFVPEPAVRVCLGLLAALIGLCAFVTWTRHRHAAFVLSAEGIAYDAWLRPLAFSDVECLSALRQYGNITLTLRLKQPMPQIWKWSPLRFRQRAISLSLSMIAKDQVELTETIHRYLTRQAKS